MSLRPPRRPPDDEQRLVVLYCLRALAPCGELQLLRFLAEYDLMNYFDMMFALNDLCARGQAVRTKDPVMGYAYSLTEAGEEAVTLFGGRVPHSVQALVEENAPQWLRRFRQEGQSAVSMRENARGDWEVTLSLTDQESDLMRLSLSLPSRELAAAIGNKWPDKAEEIYEKIIRILAGEEA